MSLISRTASALREAARRTGTDGIAQRVSERLALPQLWERYRKNTLTHGADYLRGDDEIRLFGEGAAAPIRWRAIPAAGAPSLSSATLAVTEGGTSRLSGHYGGARAELQLIPGMATESTDAPAVGAGACGMASDGHWELDLSQHHWLELRLRTDGRAYELVVQSDGFFEGQHHIWRAPIPRGPEPKGPAGGAYGGAYGVLGVERDADVDAIREAYKAVAMESHPDRGGDEARFVAASKAFAILSDPERRARYDEVGPEEEESDGAGLETLTDWRTVKMPFTAFRDRSFFKFADKVARVYILLRDELPGPFALELADLTAGRCEDAELLAAGFGGSIACEQGFCECGYYNGYRVEGFEGPIVREAGGGLPPGAIEFGHAEHHGFVDY